jgi:5-methylcytosine-specific restriction protein A
MATQPQHDTPIASSGDWSDAELVAASQAYLDMLRSELDGQSYVKSAVNARLREGPLSRRTPGAIEFRMQNISATLYDMRLPHIAGYLPAKNVGSNVKARLRVALETCGVAEFRIYRSTADARALASSVSALRKRGLGSMPSGSLRPGRVNVTSATFARDPAVKSWVLQASSGFCEGCDAGAPFLGIDGLPYLEVHHVMPLSSHGSDRVSNAAALCPNCHRRCHYAIDRDEFKLHLYQKIARLVIEVPETVESDTDIFIAPT